jgi:phosphoglycolate phosphatase
VALIVESMTAAFVNIGEVPPDEAAIRSISGITARDAMMILVPDADAARIDRITQSYRNEYASRSGGPREPMFPGARAALERLRKQPGTILAVATGKGHTGAVTVLTIHDILDWFNSVETPTHNRGKPDPQMIETAMSKVGATLAETVMIGDTVHDIRMGKAAGVKTIGVAWGYHAVADLNEAGADVVITRFEELDGALDRLLG